MPAVTQEWTHKLSFMQQSVLLSALRNEDGIEKNHPAKQLIRWYRRCIVVSAFDGKTFINPREEGGGSYVGPVEDIDYAADEFIKARDTMFLHYYAHTMQAFQIVGYKHPNKDIASFWLGIYFRMCHALHLWPEEEKELDLRLGDNETDWRAREDVAGGCST